MITKKDIKLKIFLKIPMEIISSSIYSLKIKFKFNIHKLWKLNKIINVIKGLKGK